MKDFTDSLLAPPPPPLPCSFPLLLHLPLFPPPLDNHVFRWYPIGSLRWCEPNYQITLVGRFLLYSVLREERTVTVAAIKLQKTSLAFFIGDDGFFISYIYIYFSLVFTRVQARPRIQIELMSFTGVEKYNRKKRKEKSRGWWREIECPVNFSILLFFRVFPIFLCWMDYDKSEREWLRKNHDPFVVVEYFFPSSLTSLA